MNIKELLQSIKENIKDLNSVEWEDLKLIEDDIINNIDDYLNTIKNN